MEIKNIKLINFRNYEDQTIEFQSGINFIVGKNAQGKTNLLESVYLCALGKSPRNSKEKQLIQFNKENSKINLNFVKKNLNKNIQIGLSLKNKKTVTINNCNISKLSELIGELNIVYFSPDEMKLIKEVPEDRRKFLDISISQFDSSYLYDLLNYDKVLKQRNCILKSGERLETIKEELKVWTPQLLKLAKNIILKRISFINILQQQIISIHKFLAPDETIDIAYSFNFDGNIEDKLNKMYEATIEKDIDLGFTSVGPHRDDIIIKINGKDCRYFCSQGQQRTTALTLKLANMEIVKDKIGEYPILLLDDVLSELDDNRKSKLIKFVSKYQTLITCTAIPLTLVNFNIIEISDGKPI